MTKQEELANAVYQIAKDVPADALKDNISDITKILVGELAIAKDRAERDLCIERYKTGITLCKDAYDISVAAVAAVFLS